MLKRTGLTHIDSFFSWSQRKHDELFGVYFESTLCLPVPFGLEQITKAFTNEICKSKRISEMKVCRLPSIRVTAAALMIVSRAL